MKFTFILLGLFSFNALALPVTKIIYCRSDSDFAIYSQLMIQDQHTYSINLMNQDFEPMPVDNKNIGFNESGEIISVETTYLWELFKIAKIQGEWSGEYWFDNSKSDLKCLELL